MYSPNRSKSPKKLVFNDNECESFIRWGSIFSNFLSFVRMLSSSEGKSFFKWGVNFCVVVLVMSFI